MPNRTCSIDGCDRAHYARGWCVRHYARIRATGSPGSAEIREYGKTCRVEGCTAKHHAQGYCNRHHLRWRRHGSPTDIPDPTIYSGDDHPAWKGDDVTYGRAHTRIVDVKGSASLHECAECGGQAEDWSYIHGAPDEQTDDQGRKFSTDPTYYRPLCRSCHKVYDNAMR